MSTIVVNGTNLQTAINGAQVGDTLDVRAGGYAAIDVGKKLNIFATGAARIEGVVSNGCTVRIRSAAGGTELKGFSRISGATAKNASLVLVEKAHDVKVRNNGIEDGVKGVYGIRTYEADRSTIEGNTVRRVAVGLYVTRLGNGHIVKGNEFSDIDKMLTDDGTAATNGGDAIQLYDSGSNAVIEDNVFLRCRAKSTKQGVVTWAYDGGAIAPYGVCGSTLIKGNEVRESVNFMETGTDANHPGQPTNFTIEDNDIWGVPDIAPDESKSCVGMYLRANVGFTIRKNRFHEVDDFFLRLVATGVYAGQNTGNLVTDNDIWIKPGASDTYTWNRAYVVHNTITPSTWGKIEGNRIYFDAAKSPQVAEFTGKGVTKDLATWKTWTGWGTGETWGPATPVDPCAAVKAELAEANSTIESLVGEQNAMADMLAAANGKIAAAKAALG